MYGIQTLSRIVGRRNVFENDVNMYGIQTWMKNKHFLPSFENDVNMYGIQTDFKTDCNFISLRMM